MNSYTPAQTVSRSGFSLETLRYYERIGLLDDIRRTSGGRRVFNDGDLEWLGVLRCLRDTGMPIATMLQYTDLCRGGDETMTERLALLRTHAAEVQQTMQRLREQQAHLAEKIAWYAEQIEGLPV